MSSQIFRFQKLDDKVIFRYFDVNSGSPGWMKQKIEAEGVVKYKNTFTFQKKDLWQGDSDNELLVTDQDEYIDESTTFIFATRVQDYFKVVPGVLVENCDIFFHKSIELQPKYFYAENNLSIFRQICKLVKGDIYIGGNSAVNIPIEAFDELIVKFPNTYEKTLYAKARIVSFLKDFFDEVSDEQVKYENYLNKKPSISGFNFMETFKEYEYWKYTTILNELENMLESQGYNENVWQDRIMEILLLLFPKYIYCFKSVHIKVDFVRDRYLDFLLLDANGNVDIIEVKRPSDNNIMTKGRYRKNHIPQRELAGSVMQLEKYIYHLSRWGKPGEKKLREVLEKKLKKKLPDGFVVKITNPKGMIIMGRSNDLTATQEDDFEVVKRKYRNVIDIITYDDLITRLKRLLIAFNSR